MGGPKPFQPQYKRPPRQEYFGPQRLKINLFIFNK